MAVIPDGDPLQGQIAVAVAKSAGLHLDDWQQYVLINALRERAIDNWAAFEVGVIVPRQNGKGAILEARELAGLFEFGEKLILHSAHEFKTATEAFRRVLTLIDGCDAYRRRVKKVQIGHGDEGIELLDGARLRFVARSTGSGRGFSGDLVILDEAYALTPQHMEALLPTLSARPNPQIWYTSSPPLDSMSGQVLFAARDRAESDNPGRLAWFDFGAAGTLDQLDDVDLDDRELWRQTNPALGVRITEEFVAAERRAMTNVGFARERLGIWPPKPVDRERTIDTQLWSDLADPPKDRPANVAFALVVNQYRTVAYIAYAGRDGDDPDAPIRVGLADRLTDVSRASARLLELRERHDPVGVSVRARSESLLLELQRAGLSVPDEPDHPRRGDLHVPSAAQDAAATGLLLDAARSRRVLHAADQPVDSALDAAKLRPSAGGVTWDDRAGDMAPLRAVCHALWLFESWSPLMVDDYDPLANIF